MTALTASRPTGANHVQIAITSPDILARIRQVFAGRGRTGQIDRLPYVEVTVFRAGGAAPADPSVIDDALHRLVDPVPRANATPSHRLCAEYQLNAVGAGDQPHADHSLPARWRGLALVPDPDAAHDACDPVGTLSRRHRRGI